MLLLKIAGILNMPNSVPVGFWADFAGFSEFIFAFPQKR